MNSQTARRPDNQRRTTRSTKPKRYTRQTAHVEARRDGQPLIFGWGGQFSHSEKIKIRRRAVWVSGILFLILIVGIVAAFWININIITPNKTITAVNGQNITQDEFRKLVAVKAQIEENKIKGANGLTAQSDSVRNQSTAAQKTVTDLTTKVDNLSKQVNSAPANQKAGLQQQLDDTRKQLASAQTNYNTLNAKYQDLSQNQIPNEQQLFTQSQVASESATWLQDDLLIQNWLAKQSNAVQKQVEPSNSSVNAAVNTFKANLPKSKSYSQFLSDGRISNDDVYATMTIIQRRTNMQNYQASLITSPTYQVDARGITLATQKDAQNILNQLKGGADFSTLAKQKSVDSNTKTKGGDFGWLARGEYTLKNAENVSAVVDNWLFDPSRKVNDLSPILKENGTFHVVQITAIDPNRQLDQTSLNALKGNAVQGWLWSQRALSSTNITSIDQNMLTDTNNMPPNLPAAAPAQQQQQSGGLPGSTGGLPGGQ